MGHHEQLHLDRSSQRHEPCRGGAGLAEALFATGLGLAAAIPAVIAYNQISVSLGRSAARIGTAVTALAKKLASGQRAPN